MSYHFVNRGRIFVKGLGLRTTYFVETKEATPVQVKTSGQEADVKMSPVINKRHKHSRADVFTSSWTAPSFTSQIAPTMCDRLPFATT